jgi:hypothetical protein
MQPSEGPINRDHLQGITYDDFEPLDTIEIPPTMTGATPAIMQTVYADFRTWLQGLPNIRVHLGESVDHLEELLLCSHLETLRLSVMSQFYMRHPSFEVYNRR